jgi:hypothetical protein
MADTKTTMAMAKVENKGGQGWYTREIDNGRFVLVGDATQKSNRGGNTTVASEIADEICGNMARHIESDLFGIEDTNTHRIATLIEGKWLVYESNMATYREYTTWRGAYSRLTKIEKENTTMAKQTTKKETKIEKETTTMATKMERANRLTVETTEQGYVAHFYRTHKHIADIEIPTENNEHSNALRENARAIAIERCAEIGIEWKPEPQAQAWGRKYNTYLTDEQIAEDTLTLVRPAIERLVEKCKYDTTLVDIEVFSVAPKKSNLSYIENGRYTKSGAWCCANIELLVKVKSSYFEDTLEIRYIAELKSGQLCKPKTTILEWNLMTLDEIVLNGIELPAEENVA